jgi:hypothetical protein
MFIMKLLFHTYFLIFFVNIIIALMTCSVALINANSLNAWLIEVSELMIELEIYWPYPMVYKSLRSSADLCIDSNLFSRFGSFKENSYCKASSSGSGNDLNPLASHYVVLYTAPRHLVENTLWWTSFPKNEKIIHNHRKSKINKTSDQLSPWPTKNEADIMQSRISISSMSGKLLNSELTPHNQELKIPVNSSRGRRRSSTASALLQTPLLLSLRPTKDIHDRKCISTCSNTKGSLPNKSIADIGEINEPIIRSLERSRTVSGVIQTAHQLPNWTPKKNHDIENPHFLEIPLKTFSQKKEDIMKSSNSMHSNLGKRLDMQESCTGSISNSISGKRLDMLGSCISFDLREANVDFCQKREDIRKSSTSMRSNSGKRPNGEKMDTSDFVTTTMFEQMQDSIHIIEKTTKIEFKRQREITDKIVMMLQTMMKGKDGDISTNEFDEINDNTSSVKVKGFRNSKLKAAISAIVGLKSINRKSSGKVDIID